MFGADYSSSGFNMNVRNKGYTADLCTVASRSMSFTPVVSGVNVVADQCIYTN